MSLENTDGVWPERPCLSVKHVFILAVFASGGVKMILLQRLDMLLKSFDTAKHCLLVKVLLYFEYLLFILRARSDIIA